MIITLSDIEKAVRANFLIRKDEQNTGHYKQLVVEDSRKRCLGIARIIYTGMAVGYGHRQEEICRHIEISIEEFNKNTRRFRELYTAGEIKSGTEKKRIYKRDANWNIELDLYLYRKTVLVKNYLASLQLQRKALELF